MALPHTPEQGQRLHYLANLGGLVAISGLEYLKPDLLLGLLLEVADRFPRLRPLRLSEMRTRGAACLRARAAENRAWRARQRALELHRVDLTTKQLRILIESLGTRPPARSAALVPTLSRLLQERSP